MYGVQPNIGACGIRPFVLNARGKPFIFVGDSSLLWAATRIARTLMARLKLIGMLSCGAVTIGSATTPEGTQI